MSQVLGLDSNGAACPIYQLPTELLAEIFKTCTAISPLKYVKDHAGYPHEIYLDALAISHVSKRWRSVAITTPGLWSTIFIAFWTCLQLPRSDFSTIEPIVDIYLERSKDHLLDICLWSPQSPPYSDESIVPEDEAHPVLPVVFKLLKESHRWHTALLELPFWDASKPLFFPELEELDSRLTFSVESRYVLPLIKAPKLRRLRSVMMQDDNGIGVYTRLELESGALDEINLSCANWGTAADFLATASPACIAYVDTLFALDGIDDRVVSQLKSLSLKTMADAGWGEDGPGDLLNCLMLPNVEKLSFFVDESSEALLDFPVADFVSLVHRSECSTKLTSLHIRRHCISGDDLLEVLDVLPAITDLLIEEPPLTKFNSKISPLTKHFIMRLTGELQVSPLSHLTKVEFHLHRALRTSLMDALLTFFESRRPRLRAGSAHNQPTFVTLDCASLVFPETSGAGFGEGVYSQRVDKLRVDGLLLEIDEE